MSNEGPEHTFAKHLVEANLSTKRFIDVVDGEKRSLDHTQRAPEHTDGNYGVYAGGGLVNIDVDDYDGEYDTDALDELPETFTVETPHVGEHRYYRVEGNVEEIIEETFGVTNPSPSWGEVRVRNQYVVGPGSCLDDCDKEWCDQCATDDGGYYHIKTDREIATIPVENLVTVLEADPETNPVEEDDGVPSNDEQTPVDDLDVYATLERALERDEKLSQLWRGDYSDYGNDRSAAESALAMKLAFWFQGDKHTVRRLMDRADTQKWSERTDDSYRDSILTAVDKQTEYYDPSRGRGRRDPSEFDPREVERDEALLEAMTSPDDPAGELAYKNGCYGYWPDIRDENGELDHQEFRSVTNFTLETVSFLETFEGELLNLRVHPQHPAEDPFEVQVHPVVFNETRSFKQEIVRGKTMRYEPRGRTQQALNDLRETVGSQPAPTYTGTEYIGLHGDSWDEWVSPKGTLTANGWSDDPEHVHYSKGGDDDGGALAQKWLLNPSDDLEVDDAAIADILRLLPQTRKPVRGLPVLGWFYAAPLKTLIHEWEGEFNLLQVYGDTGSGKTATLKMLWEAFGADPDPFGCSDTTFTIERHMSESCGFPVWLDEYKPADIANYRLNALHRLLREVTREKVVSKGTPDLGEVTFKLRAPTVVSGEQKFNEVAVRRRAIMTNFTNSATQEGTEFNRAFCELTGTSYVDEDGTPQYPKGHELRQHAIAYYRYILGMSIGELREAWQNVRERTADILRVLEISSLDNSEFQGLQTIVFGMWLFEEFAREYAVEDAALVEESELMSALEHVAQNIGPDGRRREHGDEFIELLSQAAAADYIEDHVHYRTIASQNYETDLVCFHMPTCFSAVKKYMRDYNLEDDYTALGKNDYLDSFRNKVEKPGSYIIETNKRVRGLENGPRAVAINPEIAAEQLNDGFNLAGFIEDIDPDDGTDEKVTPISALSSTNGYVTLTVEVLSWNEVDSEKGPSYAGVFEDESGVVDVVDFSGKWSTEELEEGGIYRVMNARSGEYDGAPQAELKPNATELEPIQHGVGLTGAASRDVGQRGLASANGGDTVGLKPRLLEHVRTECGSGDVLSVAAVAGELDEDPALVEERLESIADRDGLLVSCSGGFEVL